jgi:cellulose biosynthesis protein BcsQ
VLESFVRDDARVREAPAWRKPITTYNPDGKAYRPRSTGLGRPKHPVAEHFNARTHGHSTFQRITLRVLPN